MLSESGKHQSFEVIDCVAQRLIQSMPLLSALPPFDPSNFDFLKLLKVERVVCHYRGTKSVDDSSVEFQLSLAKWHLRKLCISKMDILQAIEFFF